MHPLVIFAIHQFDQQERDRACERRPRADELIAARERRAVLRERSRPTPPPDPTHRYVAPAPAVIGCRA